MNIQMSVSSYNRMQSMQRSREVQRLGYTNRPRVQYDDDSPDDHYYLESREFQDYAARVEGIIHTAKAADRERGLTTRQIHEKLGENARREWTADAIESLRSVETVQALVNRYRPSRVEPKYDRKWRGKDGMRWLFGTTRYGQPPYADTGVENPSSF